MSLCHGQAVVSFVQQNRSTYFRSCYEMDETEVGVAVLADFISLTTDEQPDGTTREHAQRSAHSTHVRHGEGSETLPHCPRQYVAVITREKKSFFYKSRVVMSCLRGLVLTLRHRPR